MVPFFVPKQKDVKHKSINPLDMIKHAVENKTAWWHVHWPIEDGDSNLYLHAHSYIGSRGVRWVAINLCMRVPDADGQNGPPIMAKMDPPMLPTYQDP